MRQEKEPYSLQRYFSGAIPNDVIDVITIDGIRPLKSGSKFRVYGERGDFTFLYAQQDMITCFNSGGQFKLIHKDKIKRAVNRSKREKYLEQ